MIYYNKWDIFKKGLLPEIPLMKKYAGIFKLKPASYHNNSYCTIHIVEL
jgi:hypothetical protein